MTAVELGDGTTACSFYELQRGTPMLLLLIAFVAAVMLLGRWRSLGALAGLAVSLLVLVVFALPSLLDGNNAVVAALVAASVIAFLALYLAHAGAALPLLLPFTEAGPSVGSVATSEIVATEIVRSRVGSVGLVASVPISTWLAARVVTARPTGDAGAGLDATPDNEPDAATLDATPAPEPS